MAGFSQRSSATVHHFPSDLRPNISSSENPSWQLHLKYAWFCCLVAKARPTHCSSMDCSTPVSMMSSIISWRLLIFMSTESAMLSNHLIHCYFSSPFAFNFSQHQGLFQWVGSPHQVKSKVLDFSFSIIMPSEYSGLISFRKSKVSPQSIISFCFLHCYLHVWWLSCLFICFFLVSPRRI